MNQSTLNHIKKLEKETLTWLKNNKGIPNIKEIKDCLKELDDIYNEHKIKTEDTGKIFEKAICVLYNIPYKGNYKYSIEEAKELSIRLKPLKKLFPYDINHTAEKGARYDFTTVDGTTHLSAKSTKGDGKMCPQVIGQPTKKKFCQFFNLPLSSSNEDIKKYIQKNVKQLLSSYFDHTFDSNIIYYNNKKDNFKYIETINPINWRTQPIIFTREGTDWNESTTIKIKNKTIGEFQVHNNRDGIKFRWNIETILSEFKNNFKITNF